ncbi:MAG TPA: hypothetical protein VFH31_02220 [Pyrinomonadaceae bacterium]|nr:hypothetical protein [Pyrinomonadaceae bacterium]
MRTKLSSHRRSERGAALLSMLLVTILLLGAGGALITTTMMSATTAIDSTAEMQAFYIAESGMQSALNVLRGNVQPLVTASDRMSFRTAIIPDISNGPGNTGALRLAGWLPYNTRTDPNSLVPVAVGAMTGGYRITVENLDPNSHIVEYNTAGLIEGNDAGTPFKRTYGTVGGADEVTISYTAQPVTTLTPNPHVFPLTLASSLGNFVIERPVTSIQNDVIIPKTNFEITVSQTLPWIATTTFEGTFEGDVDIASTTVKVTFDRVVMKADGTAYTLNLPAGAGSRVLDLNYTPLVSGTTAIPIRVTSPDPRRLLIKSYGFGPRGSEKRLEMMVSRAYLEFETPAGTMMPGADDCSPLNLLTGDSGTKWYSGIDRSGVDPQRPAFAVSLCDKDDAIAGIEKPDTVVDPEVGILADESGPGSVERPSFLDSADKARAYLNSLQAKAESIGRYFKPGAGSSITINDPLDSPQFTFVDGDCTLMDGAGFLVVTGKLTMIGNTDFKGAILVLGEGKLIRSGGGNGEILGGIMIAAFNRTAGGFLAPTFLTNGGGDSTVQYDSASVNAGLTSGRNVSGIREF